jgi:hypothetical protein
MPNTRAASVLGKYALNTIQSGDDEEMYQTVTDAAVYLATAGFMAAANQLLASLWAHGWPHSRHCWLQDQAMEVLWSVAGQRPANVPFAQQSLDAIEIAHRRYTAIDRWAQPPPPSWWELSGTDLFRWSCHHANPPTDLGPMPSPSDERAALLGLEKYIAQFSEDEPCYLFANATCLAAELAARNDLLGQASAFARRWAEQYPACWTGYIFATMASNRHVAPLLLKGVLAPALGVSAATSQDYLRDLQAAVEARRRRGRTLVYGKWS